MILTVICGYLLLLAVLTTRSWLIGAIFLPFFGFSTFFSVRLTTVCHTCGQVARVFMAFSKTSYCHKCGNPVAPSPLFGDDEALPPASADRANTLSES